MDLAPVSPVQIIWHEYGAFLIIGAVILAAAAAFLIIKALRKKK